MASADQTVDGQGGDGTGVSPGQRGGPLGDLSSSRPNTEMEEINVDAVKLRQSGKTGSSSQNLSPGNDLGTGLDTSNGTAVDPVMKSLLQQNHLQSPSGEPADSTQLVSTSSGHSSEPQNNGLPKRSKNRTKQQKVPVATEPAAPCLETTLEKSQKPRKTKGRKLKTEPLAMAESLQASTPTQNALQGPDQVDSGGRPKRRAAAAARKYLQSLAEELDGSSKVRDRVPRDRTSNTPTQRSGQARKRKRTVLPDESDDPSVDADFVPESKDDEESEEDPSEDCSVYDSDGEPRVPTSRGTSHSTKLKYQGCAANGLHNSIMGPIWCCANVTKAFREEHLSSWVFPEWIPSAKDWHFLSPSQAEKYLPQEEMSPAFRISREGLKEETTLLRVPRFGSLASHPERWDMVFFVGGPIWSMEWCPCPDGATDHQYAAIYCHRGMDDRHKAMETSSEPTLLQVWDMGELLYDTSPSKQPTLSYAIAIDDGCIWDMKWCPSGSWELPSTSRKAPLMPRLGLLATAFSSSKIAIYSLPHPDALRALRGSEGALDKDLLICQVQKVADLKLGSIQASHDDRSGQCFCVDWLPVKPHNILAAGFNDGTVALWNLSTKSLLQRMKSPSNQATMYPYHCFNAHDSGVRVLSWCKASSHLIVTAGDDRKVKMWDLRKTHEPSNSFRRFLSTEISWPLLWSGLCVAQESCYATYGQHGIHYLDSGYLGFKPFFMAPRKATIWSISFSDWLNTAIVGDSIGDMIVMMFPDLTSNPASLKRTSDRRFPVFTTEMVPFESSLEKEDGGEGGGGDVEEAHNKAQTYSEVMKKFYLHFHDMDLRTFKNDFQRPLVEQMLKSETKGIYSLDKMPLESLHKVRFNPNLGSLSWMLSAGHTGLVRIHCLRAMHSPVVHKMAHESQVQFAAMFLSQRDTTNESDATVVRQSTESTVEVV